MGFLPFALNRDNAGPIPCRWSDGKPKGPLLVEAWDGKDDENFIRKTMIVSRHTALFGGFFALADIVLMPHKGGIPTALTRIKWWSIPFIGGGLTYTATVNMVGGLRGKSDQYNHAAAGLAVGCLLGKHSKSVITGVVMGTILAVVGSVIKDSRIHGYEVMPFVNSGKQRGNAFSYKYDFTPRPNRTGYWVRSEEEIEEVQKRGQLATRIAN